MVRFSCISIYKPISSSQVNDLPYFSYYQRGNCNQIALPEEFVGPKSRSPPIQTQPINTKIYNVQNKQFVLTYI